jgi:GntR family transcriptional regulator, transcriptional repressor for pyruvate dehydrogenase complex
MNATRSLQSGRADDRGLHAFSPIRLRKASDEVLAVLIDAIRGGLYESGDPLPPERDLALRLGISRTVLREAIEVLRQAGVVSVRRGSGGGAFVVSTENIAQVSAELQGLTRASLRSLLEVRRPLECYGAALAADRATDEDIAELRRLVAMLIEVDDRPKEFWEVDIRFHFTVAEASKSPPIPEFLREVFQRLDAIRDQFPFAYVPHKEAIANQAETLAAIESRNGNRAVRAMDAHLSSLEVVLIGTRLPMPLVGFGGGI